MSTTCSEVVGTAGSARRFCGMATQFYFTPELHLKDGRIIRDLDDAASFAREQEVRPGVDQRDEILHKWNARRAKKTPMLQHTPFCDGWRNWTSLNRGVQLRNILLKSCNSR